MKSYSKLSIIIMLILNLSLGLYVTDALSAINSDEDVSALTKEVKELRADLKRMAQKNLKYLSLLNQINQKQVNVNMLRRKIEQTEEVIATLNEKANSQNNRLKDLSDSIKNNILQSDNEQPQSESDNIKQMLKEDQQRVSYLSSKILQSNSEIVAEKAKIEELNGKLAALEQE